MTIFDLIMKKFHEERNTKAFYSSQGFGKLWNSFKDFTKKKTFQNFISKLRKENDIPTNGYDLVVDRWTLPPKEWKWVDDDLKWAEIKKEIKNFCKEYQLAYKDWDDIFQNYLFFNEILITPDPNSHNLCYCQVPQNLDTIFKMRELVGQGESLR